MVNVVNGVVINEQGLVLLVKKKNHWILPGGKTKEGENAYACLSREFGEELSGTTVDYKNAKYFGTFEGISPNNGDQIEASVYRVNLTSLVGAPSQEISDFAWFNYAMLRNFTLSEITRKIADSLHEKSLI